MTIRQLWPCLFALLSGFAVAEDLRDPAALNSFCVEAGGDQLCPRFPDDQTDFSDKFVYMLINVETQTPFDVFSWQAFTSLNWAETGQEMPPVATDWQNFRRRAALFGDDPAVENCADELVGAEVITAKIVQSDGNALIDRHGNPIVFETRLNPAAEAYVLDETLNTLAGQMARGGREVSFPQGRLGKGATPASVLIKTAWQILPPGADRSAYVVKDGLVHIPPQSSASGQGLCLRARLGLIGMHIVSRIHSGNGDEWLWSTFEHRATAPTAGNARLVNSIFARDLFPGGCSAPDTNGAGPFILFDPNCPECKTNTPPEQPVLWAQTQPHAQPPGVRPSQIVRCWEVFEGTAKLNGMWQRQLAGTPLASYQLISTQWRGADISPMFAHGEVPRFLSNLTMETYLQDADEGTCLGCHADATTSTGRNANFTFLLGDLPDQ